MIDAHKSALLLRAISLSLFVLLLPLFAFAATEGAVEMLDLTGHRAGILSLQGSKSNPVLLKTARFA